MPPTVDGKGPTGSVKLRTPQIRYGGKLKNGTLWAAALEYSQPDLNTQEADTADLSTVQTIPDVTARIVREGIFGDVQLSVIATTISTKDKYSKVSDSFGFGTTLSGSIDFTQKRKLLYQLTWGRSISHYISTFSGTGQDAVFNPYSNKFEGLMAYSGFLSYGLNWKKDVSSNLSVGSANHVNKSYQPDKALKIASVSQSTLFGQLLKVRESDWNMFLVKGGTKMEEQDKPVESGHCFIMIFKDGRNSNSGINI